MLSRLGRTGWALVAGGALSFPPTVWAQMPGQPHRPAPGGPAAAQVTLPATITINLADAAVDIELAWLADPATFGCHLTVATVEGELVARGFVPAQGVRERALEVGRKVSPVPLKDGLLLHPGLSPRMPCTDATVMGKQANDVVREYLGRRADAVEITPRKDGEVVLRGSCESLAEKVAIARLMRQVEGCTRVTSHLTTRDRAVVQARPTMVPAPTQAPVIPVARVAPAWPGTPLPAPVKPTVPPAPSKAPAPTQASSTLLTLGDTYREATLALRDVFGNRADQIQVTVRPGGQITLRGQCQSAEEKERAGRRMKQVPGCTEVANLLVHAGATPRPLVGTTSPRTVVQASAPQAPVPVTQAKATVPAPTPKPKPAPKTAFADARPAYAYPGKASNNIVGHSPYACVPALQPTPVAAPVAVAPKKTSSENMPAVQQTMAPLRTGTGPSIVTAVRKPEKPAVAEPIKAPVAVKEAVQPVVAAPARPSPAPQPAVLPQTVTHPAKPDKVVPATPASVAQPSPAPTPAARPSKVSHQPYESSGMILLSDEELAPPVVGDAPIVPQRLEEAVRNLCGADAREVRAVVLPDRNLSLEVKLSSADAQGRVMPLLLQLPELAHPNVKLQVHLP